MTVKHIRRNYAERPHSASPAGKPAETPSQPTNPMKEMASRSIQQMNPRSSQSDGNKKSWIAPILIILILILVLFIIMRKGKSGTTAYFY